MSSGPLYPQILLGVISVTIISVTSPECSGSGFGVQVSIIHEAVGSHYTLFITPIIRDMG